MPVELPFDPELHFGESDDHRHEPGPTPDWTETTWWSFNVPDRHLAGWLYAQVRPNLGICSGGAFVYDPSAFAPWALPYYAWANFDRLPENWDFDEVNFRNGVRVKMLDPGMRYELGYRFRDHEDFIADLQFDGLTPPVPHVQGAPPFTGSSHYDQHGRITGRIIVRGESIDVDCISVRDRSWGRRPELLGRHGRLSYAFGANGSREAFLAFCAPPASDHLSEVETLTSGYLLRDGLLRRLTKCRRVTKRNAETGGVSTIELVGEDADGRPFEARGSARSAMALSGGAHVTINTLLEWQMAGGTGWGEDQDVWPFASFSDRVHGRPQLS